MKMSVAELKKRVSQIEREIKDIKEKLETLTAWKGIYVRYSYAKDTPNVIKSTVISYLNTQEEFDIIRKIKKLHFEVKPAFLETILDKIQSYNVKTEILTPLASLSDEVVNDLVQKIEALTARVKKLESKKRSKKR